jgi:long-chain acyl-CoA synthetase
MQRTQADVVAELTAPGAPFELAELEIRGVTTRIFKHLPNSLRDLFALSRTRGDRSFLVYEDETWSFEDVIGQLDALGAALVHRYGIERGDRVAIAMRNYPEWIVAFAAITSVGGIAVSMNAWWKADEMAYGLEDSGAKLLIADRERIETAGPALERLRVRSLAVRAEAGTVAESDRWEVVVVPGPTLPEVAIDPDDDATILYTSGTTGFPKGAVSTHRAVLSALSCFGLRATAAKILFPKDTEGHPFDPCFILCVPLFHVTGCVAVMLTSFASGAKIVMMYKWSPERALELIERERITNFVGVPTMSFDLLESPAFGKHDTSSLLSVGGGGAPAPPTLVARVENSFGRARPGIGYGMTETNAYGPQNGGDDYIARPLSTGRAVAPTEIRVTGDQDRPLPVGEVGEIWFRGPNLIRGYWNKPEATALTLVDGWLRSGDLGYVDEDGFVYVQDRAKDMVLRAGENIYCAEVEAALYEHPGVYEAAVFGIPHERLGEEVATALYPKPGKTLDAADVRRHMQERVANFKIPSVIEIHTEPLPRNPAGKILKREIRDELAARRA